MIDCDGRAAISWSSNPVFFKILSFNFFSCVHTLQRRLVAYSLSLSYCSQFLASKTAKNFCIPFSSTVLYFDNLGAKGEGVFFVLLSFFAVFKRGRATKIRLNEIYFYFTSFSNISNSSILRFVILYIFFLSDFSIRNSHKIIFQTRRCFIYFVVYLSAHINIAADSSNHTIHFTRILFPKFFTTYFCLRTWTWKNIMHLENCLVLVLQSWRTFSHKKSY